MSKFLKKRKKNEKGFTLVELMVVVVIIGILVAIAVPIYNGVQANAKANADAANIRTINGAIAMFVSENQSIAPTDGASSNLVPKYLQSWPTPPKDITGTYKITTSAGGAYIATRN